MGTLSTAVQVTLPAVCMSEAAVSATLMHEEAVSLTCSIMSSMINNGPSRSDTSLIEASLVAWRLLLQVTHSDQACSNSHIQEAGIR